MSDKSAGILKIMAFGVAIIAVASSASSRPARKSTTTTGLVTLMPLHAAVVTLADVGGVQGAEAPAVIELLDSTDQVLASLQGVLRPGQPLTLQLNRGDLGDFPDRVPVRARAQVGPGLGNVHPEPILTLELLNVDTLDTFQVSICPVAYGDDVASDLLFSCGPCHTIISR